MNNDQKEDFSAVPTISEIIESSSVDCVYNNNPNQFSTLPSLTNIYYEENWDCPLPPLECCENTKKPIRIEFKDVKTDFSEQQNFVILFIYLRDVENLEIKYYRNCVDITFSLTYDLQKPDQEVPDITSETQSSTLKFYNLYLLLKHSILKKDCYHSLSKKCIEICLFKEDPISWGDIKHSLKNGTTEEPVTTMITKVDNDLDNDSTKLLDTPLCSTDSNNNNENNNDIFSHSKLFPCNQKSISYPKNDSDNENIYNNDSNCNNNMSLIKYENNRNIFNFYSNNNNDNDNWFNGDSLQYSMKYVGYTGLDNLGNTCFMNAVLQCLANTIPLVNYFISKKYLNDINEMNPLGMKGRMAKEFSTFLMHLWLDKKSSISTQRLKFLLCDKASSFYGNQQHDAQEFMSFLLDAIHEDLNRNRMRDKSMNGQNGDNEDQEEDDMDITKDHKRLKMVADKSWNQYKSFNNSIIIDLFGGQFKSILTCPECNQRNVIFDPFLFVPLPILSPKLEFQLIYFERDPQTDMCRKIYRFSLKISQNSTVNDMLNKIYHEYGVIQNLHVRVIQQSKLMPAKFFNHNWLLSENEESENSECVSTKYPLLLFDYPPPKSMDDSQDEQHQQNASSDDYIEMCVIQRQLGKDTYRVDYLNDNDYEEEESYKVSTMGLKKQFVKVGLPFVINIHKSRLTFSHFCAVLCSYAKHSIIAYRSLNQQSSTSPINNRFNVQSFTPKHYARNNNNESMFQSPLLPHLIHPLTKHKNPQDAIVPFSICSLLFNENLPDEEILPAIVPNDNFIGHKIENNDSDDSPETNSVHLQNGNNSNYNNTSSSSSSTCSIKSDVTLTENGDQQDMEIDDNDDDQSLINFDNHQLIDLGKHFRYFVSMDWNTCSNSPYSVELQDLSENKYDYQPINNDDDAEITLNDCLNSFIEPEELGPQNCWHCPKCKMLREASKQLSFWRLPPILVIQLKRFKAQSLISFHNEKITLMVKYPLVELNLGKYLSNAECLNEHGEPVEPIYDLYAVVNHYGSPFRGHYTAFAKSSHIMEYYQREFGWRAFDDNRVEDIEFEKSLVTDRAYILFYKRRDT